MPDKKITVETIETVLGAQENVDPKQRWNT